MALYGAEIWWNDQNGWCAEYQKLINRPGRAVREMFWTEPRVAVLRKAKLRPVVSLLNNPLRRYGYQLLAAPRSQPTRNIFSVTLRDGE